MPRKMKHHMTIGGLALCATGLAFVGIIIWGNASAYTKWSGGSNENQSYSPGELQNTFVLDSELETSIGLLGDGTSAFAANAPSSAIANITQYDDSTEQTTEPVIDPKMRIQIPAIGTDAAVERIGLTSEGAMDVPKKPLNTGWYELGPQPGQLGNAIIAGHVDWFNGGTAVFANLHKLQAGDKIIAKNDKSETFTFVVKETRTYDANDTATEVFISNDGKAHLNLITCSGKWDSHSAEYSHRLVVFTDLETASQ